MSIVLPKIGRVRLTEELRFAGKIMSATVSREATRWFVSIQVDIGQYSRSRVGDDVVGVDLGIKVAATLLTGEQFQSPKPLKTNLKKLKRVQRKLARRQKGSKNRQKTKSKLASIYAKIGNIRKNFLHKLTTNLSNNHGTIVIEDLNVKGMLKNRRLSRAISDIGFSEFRRQLEYKSTIYGTTVVVTDRWFPSSKTCSRCGHVKQDLTLKDRIYSCESCDNVCDRDLNAALNLRTLGLRGIACGQSDNPGESSLSGAGLVEAGTKPRSLVNTY